MEKVYTYKKQGDERDSWRCDEIENGIIVNSYMVFERPYNWAALRLGLMTSKAFIRILSNQTDVNMVAYGALQTILSTESNEQHLLQMLKLTMAYTDAEKSEINDIFEKNNFTIRL